VDDSNSCSKGPNPTRKRRAIWKKKTTSRIGPEEGGAARKNLGRSGVEKQFVSGKKLKKSQGFPRKVNEQDGNAHREGGRKFVSKNTARLKEAKAQTGEGKRNRSGAGKKRLETTQRKLG